MIFCIRDDDTNFFTKPVELSASYDGIWERCPVSLSVVPFHACTPSKSIPRDLWTGNQLFSIGDNRELVSYLREMIRAGRICITLHGYQHKDEPDGPEFVVGKDLYRKVAEGKRYLEQTFQTQIRVFVPPHNSLSRQGWEAVVSNGLCISGGLSPRYRGLRLDDFPGIILRRLGITSSVNRPVKYKNHMELPYTTLSPTSNIEELWHRFTQCKGDSSLFCLATHYWELQHANQETKLILHDILKQVLSKAESRGDVRFMSLNEIVEYFRG